MHAVCSFHSYKLIFKHSGFSSSSAAEAFCELSYYEAAPAEPLKLRLLKTLSLLGWTGKQLTNIFHPKIPFPNWEECQKNQQIF